MQFESTLGEIRPRVLPVSSKQFLDPDHEILVSELAGHSTGVISKLDSAYQPMANSFRKNLRQTQIPVRFFEKDKPRQWVLFVYQTCNLAGKGLTGEDYVEAALSFYYPTLPDTLKNDLHKITSSSPITGINKKLTRSVFLKSMVDEIYHQTSFTEARKWGLDILNLRLITQQENIKTKVPEISSPLNGKIVKDAYVAVLQSMKKIIATLTNHWQLTNAKCLVTNEIVMLSAFYRSHTKPSMPELGAISVKLMLSMIRKSTTGGSTQAMTTDACNAMRTAAPGALLDSILQTHDLRPEDIGFIDAENKKKPKSALGKDSMMFQLMKLSVFRDGCVDIFTQSHALTRATFSMDDVDHFYPKSKLKSSDLMYRRDHLANFVIMSQWSNRSKGGKWPYAVIDSHKVWPKTKQEKENWKNLVLPNLPGQKDSAWAQLPKIGSKKERKFSQDLYLDFLRWRSKALVQKLNKMLKDIETNGF